MSYRYSGLDVVIGVGFCAILFGVLLFLTATSGTFLTVAPYVPADTFLSGMAWVQPALGQAIVERALLQRRTDQLTMAATAEWNQAMQAHRRLQALAGQPLTQVIRRAEIAPIEHHARVQGVLGRYIVNFTGRGFRSGALAADQYLSDYNSEWINRAEVVGRRLDDDFAATWQPLLGRWIVEAEREYQMLVTGVQEQLGTAIVHRTQAKTALEEAWSANQAQLGSLMAAVDRGPVEPSAIAAATGRVTGTAVPAARIAIVPWPDLFVGMLAVAIVALSVIFWLGLLWSAASREARASVEAQRNAGRWIYRMAS